MHCAPTSKRLGYLMQVHLMQLHVKREPQLLQQSHCVLFKKIAIIGWLEIWSKYGD